MYFIYQTFRDDLFLARHRLENCDKPNNKYKAISAILIVKLNT
jgi:hypothetical protein